MEITTRSGIKTINKRTTFGKWLIGYISTDAWTGWYTIEYIWNKQKDNKPNGCSWKAWGIICGKYTIFKDKDKQIIREDE